MEGIFISSPHSSGWRISIPPAAQYEKGGGRREYLEITKEYKRECFGAPPLLPPPRTKSGVSLIVG